MYAVIIEGGDPFIAGSLQGIKDGFEDLYGGECLTFLEIASDIAIEWAGGNDELIEAKAIKCEIYR